MEEPKLLTTPAPADTPILVKIEDTYHIGCIDGIDDQVYTENICGVYPVSKIQGWFPLPK